MKEYNTTKGRKLLPATDGRIIGWVKNDLSGTKVKGSMHMLQKPRGWAWDGPVIAAAEKMGGRRVEIFDRETGIEYWATISSFQVHGVKLDHGFGSQICLPIAFWIIFCPDGTGLGHLEFGR